jgi:hypothetical protein
MDGLGILFLILTILLSGFLVFIKFTKKGQSFVCPACPTCPSGQRMGLKYQSTNDKLVNGFIETVNTAIDSAQTGYLKCSDVTKNMPTLPPKGTKCDVLKKDLESQKFPSGQKDFDDAQQKYIDTVTKDMCLSDGTIDIDKLAASSKILQKTFCV